MPKIPVNNITPTAIALSLRIERFSKILGNVGELPETWLTSDGRGLNSGERGDKADLKPIACKDYDSLLEAWKKAMQWRQEMDDVLSVLLSVVVSTMQVGDQLFLMLIGNASGGKTRFCDALLVSKNCYALEHLTGFHSGWKDETGEDHSLISRINGKCLITPEADVIMSSPRFLEIMSQQRRIFDGSSGASYKNRKEDLRYTGLRTPWIMAGTQALLDTDQSRLGDRFLKVFIESPDHEEKQSILEKVGFTALDNVMRKSNGEASSQNDPRLVKAYSMTGGYIDYLLENIEELLGGLDFDKHWLVKQCGILAEFVADMRARPDPDIRKKDSIATKEMPFRITSQLLRLACCLAVVMNQDINHEVLRRVTKVALDTSQGVTLDMVRHIYSSGISGVEVLGLSRELLRSDDRIRQLLRFLYAIDVVETFQPPKINGITQKLRWRLTDRFERLYLHVME